MYEVAAQKLSEQELFHISGGMGVGSREDAQTALKCADCQTPLTWTLQGYKCHECGAVFDRYGKQINKRNQDLK